MESIGVQSLPSLIAFARVAAQGSYVGAARTLSVSPSAVSKIVQRLEARLQLRLFTRTTRSLTLTPEGRELFERVQRLLHELQHIEQFAAARLAEPAGVLKVAASLPVGTHIIGPLLPALREQYPQLRIDLRLSDRLIDLVEEGIDVAVRVGDPKDSTLVGRRLAPNRLCTYAAPAYLARHGTPRSPDDLAAHTLVNFRYQSSGYPLRWLFQQGSQRWDFVPDAAIVADMSDAVLAVLVAGGGIGTLATYIAAEAVARGELVPVLADYACDNTVLTAVWPRSRQNNPGVKVFVQAVVERLGEAGTTAPPAATGAG